MFRGWARVVTTRTNRKQQIENLKYALGGNHERNSSNPSDNSDISGGPSSTSSSHSSPNTKFSSLPNDYLCEVPPDKMMINALKELNINEVKKKLRIMNLQINSITRTISNNLKNKKEHHCHSIIQSQVMVMSRNV